MANAVPDLLAQIVENKKIEMEVSERRRMRPALEKRVEISRPRQKDFRAALKADPPAIIAEVKKHSPSRGMLREEFRPGDLGRAYREGGAAAVSVLTDKRYFNGTLSDLLEVKWASELPALRKDFLIDELQVLEAAAYGADAVLLIVAILSDRELRDFREQAATLGMAALVEVHDEEELRRALDSGADIIGVNNRNLRNFEVDLGTSLLLAEKMPPHVVRVAESGIHSADHVRVLAASGYDAFLVGEHLIMSEDPAAALHRLRV